MRYLFALFLFSLSFLSASLEKIEYSFSSEPIDVVIPCASKDQKTLDICIDGIKKYGQNIRRVIVVSKERLTSKAEWFNEAGFPFTKETLAYEIFKGNSKKAKKFLHRKNSRIGWIFQQFLKLYAPFVIPEISSNVLILDSDVLFIKPTLFMNEKNEPLLNVGNEYHHPYFDQMKKILPDLTKVYEQYSGVTHHMLFQKPVLEDLFSLISNQHSTVPWKAICRAINPKDFSCLSEYEIYFNFIFLRTNQAHLRPLSFTNTSHLEKTEKYKNLNYSYITSHNYQ